MSDIAIAALLAGTILVASTISVEIGLSVALIELLAGVIVGNALQIDVPAWLAFVGSFADRRPRGSKELMPFDRIWLRSTAQKPQTTPSRKLSS